MTDKVGWPGTLSYLGVCAVMLVFMAAIILTSEKGGLAMCLSVILPSAAIVGALAYSLYHYEPSGMP